MRRTNEGSTCRSRLKKIRKIKSTNAKYTLWRTLFYAIGAILLAAGLTLNTKTGLGTAPVITTPFAVSQIWGFNFAGCVFVIYTIMTCLQFFVKREWQVFLQIPFSIAFSTVLNIFGSLLDFHFTLFWQNLLLLAAAIVITGIGVSLMLNMKLISNPADGFASTVGELCGRGMGFGKNAVDLLFVAITAVLTLAVSGHLMAIGLGTLVSMIGVGRVIAVFNHLFQKTICRLAGLEQYRTEKDAKGSKQ